MWPCTNVVVNYFVKVRNFSCSGQGVVVGCGMCTSSWRYKVIPKKRHMSFSCFGMSKKNHISPSTVNIDEKNDRSELGSRCVPVIGPVLAITTCTCTRQVPGIGARWMGPGLQLCTGKAAAKSMWSMPSASQSGVHPRTE